jgi:hypothetical protein
MQSSRAGGIDRVSTVRVLVRVEIAVVLDYRTKEKNQ